MSDSEPNRSRNPSQTGPVWSLAAFSAAVFLCSVLGAKLLSRFVDSDDRPRLVYERAMRQVANSGAADGGGETQVYSIVRSIGVDGITTATIPLRGPAPLSPCGDEVTGPKPRK
jgi:hypothetical protein